MNATGNAMIAFPWFLLAFGVILVLVGFLLEGLGRATRPRQKQIDSRMRNKEIARLLRESQRITLPQITISVGVVCALISLVWRLAVSVSAQVR
jgi:hypothetical protein